MPIPEIPQDQPSDILHKEKISHTWKEANIVLLLKKGQDFNEDKELQGFWRVLK